MRISDWSSDVCSSDLCIFAGEEYAIAIGRRTALVRLGGGDENQAARTYDECLAVGAKVELSFQDVDPLFVGVQMRIAHLAGGGAHQCDDHAVAFDTATKYRGITRSAHDLIDSMKIEDILTSIGALGAGGAGADDFEFARSGLNVHGCSLG